MQKGPFLFEVLIGDTPAEERYSENCKCFIPCSVGQEFTLRVRNLLPKRVMAACFVDGLGVIDGEPDEDIPHGYMVEANSYIEIPGWRLDEENVARFEFQTSAGSYAAKMGKSLAEQGTLRCKIYLEKIASTTPPGLQPKNDKHRKLLSEAADSLKNSVKTSPTSDHNNDFSRVLCAGRASLPFEPPPKDDFPLKSRSAGVESGNPGKDLMDFLNQKSEEDEVSSRHQTDNIGVGFGKKAASQMENAVEFNEASKEPHTTFAIHYDTSLGLAKKGVGCPTPPGWKP